MQQGNRLFSARLRGPAAQGFRWEAPLAGFPRRADVLHGLWMTRSLGPWMSCLGYRYMSWAEGLMARTPSAPRRAGQNLPWLPEAAEAGWRVGGEHGRTWACGRYFVRRLVLAEVSRRRTVARSVATQVTS